MTSPRPAPSPSAERLARWALPLATLVFFLVTARGYGVFRDELYYLACARHLAWGYVDHPPMVAAVAALVGWLFGESWLALRMVSALVMAGTVLLVGETSRALGGGVFARVTAQLLAAGAPIFLSLFSIYSMNALDVLAWAALGRIAVGLLAGASPLGWLGFGLVAGLGLLTKYDVGLLGLGFFVGLLVSRRDVLANRWPWTGGLVAAAVFLPHVLWQIVNDFPTREFVQNAQAGKIAARSPLEFLAAQAEMAGPLGFLAAVVGLGWLLAARAARPWRPLGWAVVVVFAVFASSVSKPYYFAPAFALLFPAAGVALAGWGSTAGGRTALRVVVLVAGMATFALAPLAKPLLAVDDYLAYARALGLSAESDERHRLGRLPQFFADMHGWEELAASVAAVYRQLPAAEQAAACIYAQNYGEAGAIDHFGPALGLPRAMSGHNNYWLWGPGDCSGAVVLIIGGRGEDHLRNFATVEQVGVHDCTDCMPYEDDLPLWVARGLRVPLAEAWQHTRHFN
jgi:hypothetical protein